MFKNQPKGLIAAALANMGERFGFYTMMAILSLFLMSKFGLDGVGASWIYSTFYFSIYVLAFVGGLIADKTKNYKGTILAGLLLMAVGYLMVSYPTPTPVVNKMIAMGITCFGLFIIAFGNGLFKGNLQALVGQMYDNEKYAKKRDAGFSIFYMFINVGSIFAPFTAVAVRNWWLSTKGFIYNPDLPKLCHEYLDKTKAMTAGAAERYQQLASEVSINGFNGDLNTFANEYLSSFVTGFHYAFAVAIVAMAISLVIYLTNKNKFPDPKNKKVSSASSEEVTMSIQEIRQRIWALVAVFAVVIFFWFSFHQNGLTLTYFAKDYTDLSNMKLDLGFTVVEGAELFQSFNPLFVVLLTPVVLAVFGWLSARGKEPSTPKKIMIGMGIASLGFVVMALGSLNAPSYQEITSMGGLPQAARITPWLLIGTYLILTVAELFISPLGISFVSKVAPPQYQGVMQGGWLGATAVGNQLLLLGAVLYQNVPIWVTWTVFVVVCVMSMCLMMFMLKWLERVTK